MSVVASRSVPLKSFDLFAPVSIEEPQAGHYIYDFGQNCSAKPRICVQGKKGQTIRLTPAEQRQGQSEYTNDGKGRVNQGGVGRPNYWEYTLRGNGKEIWTPQFTYSGFQYIELTGGVPAGHTNPDNLPVVKELISVHIRAAVDKVGRFKCSSSLFNQIDQLIDWAVRSNMSHVLTDCPHREKLGWLEESYLMGPAVAWKYDMVRFFNKITQDIRDSQDVSGAIYTVAPNYPVFNDGYRYTPEWGAVGILVPWQTWQWYGDKRCLRDNYSMMKRYVDYMESTSTDLIPIAGLGDWYDYGHGNPMGASRYTPVDLTATAIFYLCAKVVSDSAGILGNTADHDRYAKLAENIKEKYNKTYFDGKDTYLNKGSCQTANAMSLAVGLVDAPHQQAVLGKVIDDIRARGNQQTAGDVGHIFLLTALRQMGRSDVIFDMTNRRNSGSYGNIIEKGWTSMPEAWNANTSASMNHFMLGHIQEWFQQGLVGIQPDPSVTGFKKIIIKPEIVGDLTWCKGSHESLYGIIESAWRIINKRLYLDVTIPANTTASIYMPVNASRDVHERQGKVEEALGVVFDRIENDRSVYNVESGRYCFWAPYDS